MSRTSDGLRTLPVRITVLVALALAVVLPAGRWLEKALSDRLIESRRASLREGLVKGASATGVRLQMAEIRTAALAKLVSAAAQRIHPDDARRFAASLKSGPDGTTRLARRPDVLTEALVWLPPGHPRGPDWDGLFGATRPIVGLLGAGTVGESVEDVWFMSVRGGEIIYIPGDPGYVDRPASVDYEPETWITPVLPANNPERKLRWLPAQRAPRPPTWYASIAAPVYREDELIGVAGMDFALGGLFTELAQSAVEPGNGLLVVQADGLIPFGLGTTNIPDTDSVGIASLPAPLRDSVAALVSRSRTAAVGALSLGAVDTREMQAIRLPGLDWTVVAFIEREAVIAPLRGPLRQIRLVMIGVFGILLRVALLAAAWADARQRRVVDNVQVRARERFIRLFQMLPVPVLLARTDGDEVIEANDAALRMAGVTRSALVGGTTDNFGLWQRATDREAVLEQLRTRGVVPEHAGAMMTAGGRLADIVMAARTIDLEGEPHTLYVLQDLSERRALEAQLAQAQKLEAIGRLAGGVAHDFNNLLTAVIGYTELLRDSMSENDRRRLEAEEILKAAQRGAGLTQQLLGFARQQVSAPQAVVVNTRIWELEGLLRPLIGEDVILTTDLHPDAGTVLIDPGQLEQVITNLVVNARDAMPSGGLLAIRTRTDGRQVAIEVRDTGTGITEADQRRIFEPFFTTKAVGQGTGLGLATCYGIVSQAGGTIECDSEVGIGTVFRVSLPRLGDAVVPLPQLPSARPIPIREQAGRIMVIEDESMVRATTAAILRSGGYEVVEHEDPRVALTQLTASDERIDLILSDIVMPGMSGPAFARELARDRADIPILFMSGYNPEHTLENPAEMGYGFLAKPFTREQLLRAVAEELRAPVH
ncbi:MAG: ATP-binding protein [Gemmatimonadales bacterium]